MFRLLVLECRASGLLSGIFLGFRGLVYGEGLRHLGLRCSGFGVA